MTKLLFILGVTSTFFLAPAAVASCVTLEWVATGDDGYEGRAYRYDIRMSTGPIREDLWDSYSQVSYIPKPAPSGHQETIYVGELEPGRTYYFAMKVADEWYNWSVMSNVVTKQAPPEFPCGGDVGNANCDGFDTVSVSDISALIAIIFLGYPSCCPLEANANGDPDGLITVGDISRLIDHLYITGTPLPFCASN